MMLVPSLVKKVSCEHTLLVDVNVDIVSQKCVDCINCICLSFSKAIPSWRARLLFISKWMRNQG